MVTERKTFALTAEQAKTLEQADNATFEGDYVDLRTGAVKLPNPVSRAWDALGAELGFDPDTVEFTDNDDTFTAEVDDGRHV